MQRLVLILTCDGDGCSVHARLKLDQARLVMQRPDMLAGQALEFLHGSLVYTSRLTYTSRGSTAQEWASQYIRVLTQNARRYNRALCEFHGIDYREARVTVLRRQTAIWPALRQCFHSVHVSRRTRENGSWRSRGSQLLCVLWD